MARRPKQSERKKLGRIPNAVKLAVAAERSAGASKLSVAKKHDIDPRTIWRWEREDDEYRAHVAEFTSAIKTDAYAEALNVLRQALRPEDAAQKPIPMHTRLRAAAIVVQSADRQDHTTVDVTHGGSIRVISVPERKRNG